MAKKVSKAAETVSKATIHDFDTIITPFIFLISIYAS